MKLLSMFAKLISLSDHVPHNPVHTFITYLFTIRCKVICSSYCAGRYWIPIL